MRVIQRVGVMNRGGQETLWMNFLRKSRNIELQMDFLVGTSLKGDYDDEIRDLGAKVIYQGDCRKKGILKWFDNMHTVAKTLKSIGKCDVFHINNYLVFDTLSDVIAAKLAGINKIIVHSHNSEGPHRIVQIILRPILNKMGIIRVACSDKAAEWMFGTKDNIPIINNGIETEKYKLDPNIREQFRESLKILNDEILIGHVGRFDEQKNHTFLLDIFFEISKRNDKVKLILVGCGPLETLIREKVKKLELEDKVIFYGTSNKVNEIMMAMDLFLFPSLYEGLPLVLVEAQASGLRIVCSDTISQDTIITDLVTMVDINKSASAWADVVFEKLGYERKDYNTIVYDKGFDINQTILQVLEIYEGKDI